jgi:hypothetical protein
MLKTSLLLSVLSAMLSVEVSNKSTDSSTSTKAQDSSLVVNTEQSDEQRIEEEARRHVGHTLADD